MFDVSLLGGSLRRVIKYMLIPVDKRTKRCKRNNVKMARDFRCKNIRLRATLKSRAVNRSLMHTALVIRFIVRAFSPLTQMSDDGRSKDVAGTACLVFVLNSFTC